MKIELIKYDRKHLIDIIQLFNNTIQTINSMDYSKDKLDEWYQINPDYTLWDRNLSNTYCVLAISNEKVLGFGNITSKGYLDLLYVDSACIDSGIGSTIYTNLEEHAKLSSFNIIYTDSSITAVPFFRKVGFDIEKKQNNIRNGKNLINYRMSKTLKYQ